MADENSVTLRAPGIIRLGKILSQRLWDSGPELNAGTSTLRHPFEKLAIWPKTPDLGDMTLLKTTHFFKILKTLLINSK